MFSGSAMLSDLSCVMDGLAVSPWPGSHAEDSVVFIWADGFSDLYAPYLQDF